MTSKRLDHLSETVSNSDENHIVIYDGLCNLCDISILFIIRNDQRGKFKFVSCQSELGRKLQCRYEVDTIQEGTVILIKHGEVYIRSDAAVEIARELDSVWKYVSFLRVLPRPFRDYLYTVVSKNRYRWFGKKNECLLPDDHLRKRFIFD